MSIKKTIDRAKTRAKQVVKVVGGIKNSNPYALAPISGRKPKAGKIKMGPTKVTSTIRPKVTKK